MFGNALERSNQNCSVIGAARITDLEEIGRNAELWMWSFDFSGRPEGPRFLRSTLTTISAEHERREENPNGSHIDADSSQDRNDTK